ncbi:MAG: DUF4336 domain-containing protein [Bdellovibrionales bacterium]|nr:DUF4336 domain-containing protein [Bdellovibrionales bacterium]
MLKAVADGLWVAEDFLKAPAGMKMAIRSTIIALDANNLMVISPIEPTPKLVEAISDIGMVKYIVAPNGMHHLYVNKFAANFPEAEIWGPADLHAKRNDIQFSGVLDTQEVMPWDHYVEMHSLKARAPMFEEFLFFHPKTKTLIVTDMMFNFHHFDNWLMKLIAKINGGYNRLAMTRIGKMYFNNKESLKSAVRQILDWKPDNLIVAHGDIIQGGATPQLVAATERMR